MPEKNGKQTMRLLKVIVQPIFVSDDGENLTELVCAPVHVSAAEWPTYATTTFLESVENIQLASS